MLYQEMLWVNIGVGIIENALEDDKPADDRDMNEARDNEISAEPFLNRAHLRASFGGDSSCVRSAMRVILAVCNSLSTSITAP